MFMRRCVSVGFIILLTSGSLRAFTITVHEAVTRTGLTHIQTDQPALLQGRNFSDLAIQEVVDANLSMDVQDCSVGQRSDEYKAIPCPTAEFIVGTKIYGPPTYASDHFDDERFADGNNRLMRYRSAAIAHLKAGNYIGARKQLGFALHTLQDFYAHSNWVDLGFPCCALRLGFTDAFDKAKPYRVADSTEPTCQKGDPSTLLPEFAQNNGRAGLRLTSGYYPNDNEAIQKSQKCAHGEVGVLFDGGRGINKDDSDLYGDPNYTDRFATPNNLIRRIRFETAKSMAASHTTSFVEGVLTDGCAGVPDCVAGFLGYPKTTFMNPNVTGPVMRDCNQHLYNAITFVFLVQTLTERLAHWAKTDAEVQRRVQQGTGEDLTQKVYSAGFLERVPDCIEPVVHVLTGNQVPGNTAGRATSVTPGLTLVIKAMPKTHCVALNTSGQVRFAQGSFAIRFEPPGPSTNWRLGECADNPLVRIFNLPQPNTAYMFFPPN
jgi:hypothetical protein